MSCQLSVLHEIWDSFFYRPDSDSLIHGFMDSWIHGFMDSWIHGRYKVTGTYGTSFLRFAVSLRTCIFLPLPFYTQQWCVTGFASPSSIVRVFFALPTCQHTSDPAILHHCRHVQRPTFYIYITPRSTPRLPQW